MAFLLPSAFLLLPSIAADGPAPLYSQNFETAKPGDPPADMLVINGTFKVVKADGNAFLEMAGDPLESDGVLVGPADLNAYAVAARVHTTSVGKRMPEFGLGACGPGLYRLWVMPAAGELQLMKADEVQKAVPFAWATNTWTRLKLQVRKSANGKFTVEGKAWPDGKDEPKEWMLAFEDPEDPAPGRAGVFATPFPGTPFRFDDITVTPAK